AVDLLEPERAAGRGVVGVDRDDRAVLDAREVDEALRLEREREAEAAVDVALVERGGRAARGRARALARLDGRDRVRGEVDGARARRDRPPAVRGPPDAAPQGAA